MGRAPCCEKMGLKKGPWTREEDHILINYINLYGHGNWRALPKQAGLLRCGKSCRLRWTNYLRPDIKRGNFSEEEEDSIIKLHRVLGNRWSAIAAKLPGRTDNEIKNVWHTHLKKRLNQIKVITPDPEQNSTEISNFEQDIEEDKPNPVNFITQTTSEDLDYRSNSPQYSSSDMSSATTTISGNNNSCMMADPLDNFPEVDDNFWSDIFSVENSGVTCNFSVADGLFSPLHSMEYVHGYNSNLHDGMDFWYDLFTRAGELPEMPELQNQL